MKRRYDSGMCLPIDEHGNWILPRAKASLRSCRSGPYVDVVPCGLDPRVREEEEVDESLEDEFKCRLDNGEDAR